MTILFLGKILYGTSALLMVTALMFSLRAYREKSGREHKGLAAGIGISLFLALAVAGILPAKQRVYWDENVLFSTSLAMRFGQSAAIPTMSLPVSEGLMPVQFAVDKRPPLFPFLGSLAHFFLPPKEDNLFLINAVVLYLILLGLFLALFQPYGWKVALSAQLLVLSSPIVLWTSRSGGMDLLGAALMLAFAYAAAEWQKSPSRVRLERLLLCALLASYCRYEAVGFAAPVFLYVLACSKEHLRRRLALFAVFTIFLLPLVWQLSRISIYYVEAKEHALFRPAYLPENMRSFLKSFFSPSFGPPFNGWVSFAGLASLIAFGYRGIPRVGLFVLLAAAYQLTLVLFLHKETAAHNAPSARLYLLTALALSLAPLLCLRHLHAGKKLWTNALLGFSLITCLGAGIATYIREASPPPIEQLTAERLSNLFLDPKFPRDRVLIVSDINFFVQSRSVPSVNTSTFLDLEPILQRQLQNGQIREVFWLTTPVDDPRSLYSSSAETLEKKYRWVQVAAWEGGIMLRRGIIVAASPKNTY